MTEPSLNLLPAKDRKTLAPLLKDAIKTLQDPYYNPEGDQFKSITSILRNCGFFRDNLPKHIKLNKFADLAKLHVNPFTEACPIFGKIAKKNFS